MFTFIIPYNLRKTKTMKNDKFVMQMSWWGGKSDNDDSDRGAKIDWDAYDKINSNNNNSSTSEDRGVIEVPAGSESVIYQDEEGNYYEVDIGELEEYDDDGEIEHSKSGSVINRITAKKEGSVANKSMLRKYNTQLRYNSLRSHLR